MHTSKIAACLIGVALIAAAPGLAEQKETAPHQPPKIGQRTLHLEDAESAARFVEAVGVLTENNPLRSKMTVRVEPNGVVAMEGPPRLLEQIASLTGVQKEDRAERRAHGTKGEGKAERHTDRIENRREVERRTEGQRGERRTQAEGHKNPPQRRPDDRGAGLQVRVFTLAHAEASRLVDYVEMLRVGTDAPWHPMHDSRTNSIIVKGPVKLLDEAAELIRELDRPGQDGESVMKLMPLSHADAMALADVVSRVGRRTMRGTAVVPDERTNTIVLAGPQDEVGLAANIVRRLDVQVGPTAKVKARPEKGAAADHRKKGANEADRKKGPGKPHNKGKDQPRPPHKKPVPPAPAESDSTGTPHPIFEENNV